MRWVMERVREPNRSQEREQESASATPRHEEREKGLMARWELKVTEGPPKGVAWRGGGGAC